MAPIRRPLDVSDRNPGRPNRIVVPSTYDRNRLTRAVTTTGSASTTMNHRYDVFGRATTIDVGAQIIERDLTENLALYGRLGYVEYDRRPVTGFSLVFLRKQL